MPVSNWKRLPWQRFWSCAIAANTSFSPPMRCGLRIVATPIRSGRSLRSASLLKPRTISGMIRIMPDIVRGLSKDALRKLLPLRIGVATILKPQRIGGEKLVFAAIAHDQNRCQGSRFQLDTGIRLVVERPLQTAHVEIDSHSANS